MSYAVLSGEYRDQMRCDECGKFIKIGTGDSYTIWGSASYDPPEPYDPTDLCERCSRKLYDRLLRSLIEHGLPSHDHRPYWQSPSVWPEAKSMYRSLVRRGMIERKVRHERVRSEIRHGRDQLWYCGKCGRPEKHPGHDPKEAQRLRVRICFDFRRQSGIWLAPNYIRRWCACGWSTPWVSSAKDGNDAITPPDAPWCATGFSLADELLRSHIQGERA